VLYVATPDRRDSRLLRSRATGRSAFFQAVGRCFPALSKLPANTDAGGPTVTGVTWSGVRAQEIDFTVTGKNFQPNPLVFIAQYTRSGGWTYLASLQPRSMTPNH